MKMSYRSVATSLLVIAGMLIVGLSIGWWWLTYRDVISYDYMSLADAGVCLVRNTDTCALARSLCRSAHPLTLMTYRSAVFWIGVSSWGASLVTGLARSV